MRPRSDWSTSAAFWMFSSDGYAVPAGSPRCLAISNPAGMWMSWSVSRRSFLMLTDGSTEGLREGEVELDGPAEAPDELLPLLM